MKKFVLGLILILLVSGCAGLPDFGIFPNGNKVNKTELGPDLVVIESVNTIPNPPINAGDQFSISFEIKNQDDINDVKVGYSLFDTGLCSYLNSSQSRSSKTDTSLAPLQMEFYEWTFNSPSNSEIAFLPNKCPIRWKINYTFNATSQIDINVISQERLSQLQRSGNPPTFTPNIVIGRGPVKVDMTFGASLPARNSSSLPIFLTIQDKGTGLLKEIPASTDESLYLKVPDSFGFVSESCDKFEDTGSSVTEGDITYKFYRNKVPISIIKKSSPQIRCLFTAPNSAAINDIEKTFFITSSLKYSYEITGETSVNVKPTASR